MKLSLSVFGSTTSTVEAPRGAQYSRLSGPAQIPLFSLPCFLPLRPPVPEPVNGGRRCRACGAFRRPPLAVRRACLKWLSLALAWPKSARIGFYGRPRHRQPSPPAGVESSGFSLQLASWRSWAGLRLVWASFWGPFASVGWLLPVKGVARREM